MQKFRLHATFDHANAQEIAKIFRKFADAVDNSEKRVAHKWHMNMPRQLFDTHGMVVGSWIVTT
jgi:hypothetical protein